MAGVRQFVWPAKSVKLDTDYALVGRQCIPLVAGLVIKAREMPYTRCVYCLGSVTRFEKAIRCGHCRALTHPACAREYGPKCPACFFKEDKYVRFLVWYIYAALIGAALVLLGVVV